MAALDCYAKYADVNMTEGLFTENNDANAFDLFLRTDEEFLSCVEAGARHVQDESAMANEFAMAANLLRDAAIKSGTPWFYAHPILFLYRHTIELYLKGLVPQPRPTHNLLALRDSLIEYIKSRYGYDISGGWVAETITEFATIDPSSTRFRYARDNRGNPSFDAEQVVNLDKLKTRMDTLFLLFMNLKMAQRGADNN